MLATDSSRLLDILKPKSIAIVGASSDPVKFSGRLLTYLTKRNYPGTVYPINSRREEIMGFKCYPDLASIPGQVDVVVYSLDASNIEGVLAECERRGGVKCVVVFSHGFAERGDDEGRRRQQYLADFAERTGIRILGPNCVGFCNLVDSVALVPTITLEVPVKAGRVGMISQSGGLVFGSVLLPAHDKGIGLSRIITTGNEADTGVAEWGSALVDDPHTDCIAIALETVRKPMAFRQFLQRAQAAGKPVVLLKSARTSHGEKMAVSHTGALVGSQAVFEALCAQFGATLVEDIDDLYEIASMFAKLRHSGKLARSVEATARGGIGGITGMSISGGQLGLFVDIASSNGLPFPVLADGTQARVARELGHDGHVLNPVDLTANAVSDHGLWGRTAEALAADPSIGIVVPVMTHALNYDPVLNDLIRIDAAQDKPVIVAWVGSSFEGGGKAMIRASAVPTFDSLRMVSRALAALRRYCHNAAAAIPLQDAPAMAATNAAAVKEAAAELRRLAHGQSMLGEADSKRVLERAGFPSTLERFASTTAEAVAAARAMGFPIVLKGAHPEIAHKSEAGLVKLRLSSTQAVEIAAEEILDSMHRHAPAHPQAGILVQEMVPQGIELILGVKRDPVFGPAVMFGLGGIFVEIFSDAAVAPAPVTHAQALAMIDSLKGAPLLKGARGRRPADLDAIASLIVALGEVAVSCADIVEEIDVNPLIFVDRVNSPLKMVDALIVLRGAQQEAKPC